MMKYQMLFDQIRNQSLDLIQLLLYFIVENNQ